MAELLLTVPVYYVWTTLLLISQQHNTASDKALCKTGQLVCHYVLTVQCSDITNSQFWQVTLVLLALLGPVAPTNFKYVLS